MPESKISLPLSRSRQATIDRFLELRQLYRCLILIRSQILSEDFVLDCHWIFCDMYLVLELIACYLLFQAKQEQGHLLSNLWVVRIMSKKLMAVIFGLHIQFLLMCMDIDAIRPKCFFHMTFKMPLACQMQYSILYLHFSWFSSGAWNVFGLNKLTWKFFWRILIIPLALGWYFAYFYWVSDSNV